MKAPAFIRLSRGYCSELKTNLKVGEVMRISFGKERYREHRYKVIAVNWYSIKLERTGP